MAVRKTKMGDAEKLDDTNMIRVIQMLEAEKPCKAKYRGNTGAIRLELKTLKTCIQAML